MNVRKRVSKPGRHFATVLGIGFALCVSTNVALADDHDDLSQLTAQWWQWAFSIPAPQNPIIDPNGGNCMIGQRDSVWFLAGYTGGTTQRTCDIPGGTSLFFPVINQVYFNSPGCGQDNVNLSVKFMRNFIGQSIDSV